MDDRFKPLEYIRVRQLRASRLLALMSAYAVLGITASVAASIYFAYTLLPLELSQDQVLSLIIAGAGLVMAVLGALFVNIDKKRREVEAEVVTGLLEVQSFLSVWTEFEGAVISLAHKQNPDVTTVHEALRALSDEVSPAEMQVVETALATRNGLMHGSRTFPYEVLSPLARRLTDIIGGLNTRFAERPESSKV